MTTTLDWSSAEHWSPQRQPCFLCGAPTNLRTANGRPAHKFCVERAIDQRRHLVAVPDTERSA